MEAQTLAQPLVENIMARQRSGVQGGELKYLLMLIYQTTHLPLASGTSYRNPIMCPCLCGRGTWLRAECLTPLVCDVDQCPAAFVMRRMLSNRESARRSRRRKQEHLSQLEDEVHPLEMLFTSSMWYHPDLYRVWYWDQTSRQDFVLCLPGMQAHLCTWRMQQGCKL